MLLMLAATVTGLITHRPTSCRDETSCPTSVEVAAAVNEYESDRLAKVQAEWEKNRSEGAIIIGPHMLKISGFKLRQCVNESSADIATCSFYVNWGKRREHFIADLQKKQAEWRIIDAKSIVESIN